MILVAIAALFIGSAGAEEVSIRFRATVGKEDLRCGSSYSNIGVTKSTITPRDFRFYVHNVRLVTVTGGEVAVDLKQDGKWQYGGTALLDFEDGTGGCRNGTAEMHREVTGSVPAGGKYRALRFALGVPMMQNHTELLSMPSPLNLTALSWVWNAGRKFARLDFASTGAPRGYLVHLGSTGCTPNSSATRPPTQCASPNRVEVELTDFDPPRDEVIADLAAILKDSNVDRLPGCMSEPDNPSCVPILKNFGTKAGQAQTFFRRGVRR